MIGPIRCAVCVLGCLLPALALAGDRVAWTSDVDEAWKTAQQQGKPLLVLVTSDACPHCDRMKSGTLADADVARAIAGRYVPLALDRRAPSPLLSELAVKSFPALFVISPRAVVLARVDGYLPPDRLRAKLATLPAAQQAVAGAR